MAKAENLMKFKAFPIVKVVVHTIVPYSNVYIVASIQLLSIKRYIHLPKLSSSENLFTYPIIMVEYGDFRPHKFVKLLSFVPRISSAAF